MIKAMLVRGGIAVVGLMVTQAVVEKLERAELKRMKTSNKVNSKKKGKDTEEEILDKSLEESNFQEMDVVK